MRTVLTRPILVFPYLNLINAPSVIEKTLSYKFNSVSLGLIVAFSTALRITDLYTPSVTITISINTISGVPPITVGRKTLYYPFVVYRIVEASAGRIVILHIFDFVSC